jgi:hypothetical protein
MNRLLPLALALCLTSLAHAQSETNLPIRSVTLFSSGVSYTQREGEVTGDASISLSVRTAQMNDVLKSLVLLDERGKVQPAVYAAKDPAQKTLSGFAIDLRQVGGMTDLLGKLRGARAILTTEKGTSSGLLLGIESRKVAINQGWSDVLFVNLMGDDGLSAVRLDEIKSVKFADEKLSKELSGALVALASASDETRRTVSLRFSGEGKRRVRAGYLTDSPLWKVSYRLVLADTGKSYLQGWAHIENVTDEDWVGVKLSLVSGRPVSFIQDLYQPQYLARPVVGEETVETPFPLLSEMALESNRDSRKTEEALRRSTLGARGLAKAPATRGGGGFGGGRPVGIDNIIANDADNTLIVGNGSVEAQAEGQQTGELFAYEVSQPLTLPKQQAAMIPIVSGDISTEKVSVYNPDTIGSTFPMNAVRVKNDSGLYLKSGPVTLLDGGSYAGDARMLDVPPGDTRLLTYALDLSVVGERQSKGGVQRETGFLLKRGVLTIQRRERMETLYTFKNKAAKARKIIVEHPFNANFSLAAPEKPDERTSGLYRFSLAVPAGKTEKLTVAVERPLSESIALLNGDLDQLMYYTERKEGVPEKIKTALAGIMEKRRKVGEIEAQIGGKQTEIASLDQDQSRVRQNMAALDRDNLLYKRYVVQLDQQETKIQDLRQSVARLRTAALEASRALRSGIDALDLES